jgi:ankyrin repeat protein
MDYSYEGYIKDNHNELLNYVKFDLNYNNFIKKLFINSVVVDENVLKHVIDNATDLECEDNERMKPIHYICALSTPEMIKYIIDKGVNLECENEWKKRPIHYICQYSTPEMIKYIIDKGVNLECKNVWKNRPIHYICQYSTPEMINYIIDKGIELNFNDELELEKFINKNNKLSIEEKNKMIEYINNSKNIKNVMVKKAIKKN